MILALVVSSMLEGALLRTRGFFPWHRGDRGGLPQQGSDPAQIHRLKTIHSIRQGITVYPQEADEIHRLPGSGDHRLNIAKARSRNQIEPGPIWDAGV